MSKFTNKKILVVDDNDVVRDSAQVVLEGLGFDVTTVSNGQAAIEQCRISSFDIVLMDVDMPAMSGSEACRQIVSQRTCHCVILMTGRNQADDLTETSGAFALIDKPFRVDDLLAKINGCLQRAA